MALSWKVVEAVKNLARGEAFRNARSGRQVGLADDFCSGNAICVGFLTRLRLEAGF